MGSIFKHAFKRLSRRVRGKKKSKSRDSSVDSQEKPDPITGHTAQDQSLPQFSPTPISNLTTYSAVGSSPMHISSSTGSAASSLNGVMRRPNATTIQRTAYHAFRWSLQILSDMPIPGIGAVTTPLLIAMETAQVRPAYTSLTT
jgi:hypothetical protein